MTSAETFGDEKEKGHDKSTLQKFGINMAFKPDTYNGLGDWEEYILHFELCAKIGKWTDIEKTLILGISLTGQARTFYTGLQKTDREDYNLLRKKLEKRFGETRKGQILKWRREFENRRRNFGESITSLADDLRLLSRRAYGNFDVNTQEYLAMDQLYKSIKPEIKLRCFDRNCKTLEDAIEVIETYEEMINNHKESRKINSTHEKKDCQTESKNRNLKKKSYVDSKPLIEEKTHRRPTNKQHKRSKRCFICNLFGHFKRDCPYLMVKRK